MDVVVQHGIARCTRRDLQLACLEDEKSLAGNLSDERREKHVPQYTCIQLIEA